MKLIHKGQEITPTLEDGRYFYEYMPAEIKEEIILQHDGQIGDWVLEQVQINEGVFEKYEPNENTESQLGAAFRHINELRTFVRDEDGNLTRFTKETLKSTLSVYQDILAGTSNETLESDEGLYRVIQNTLSEDFTRFIQDDSTFAFEVGKLIGEDAEIEYEEVDVEFAYLLHEGLNAGTGIEPKRFNFEVLEGMQPYQTYYYRFGLPASGAAGQTFDFHRSTDGTNWLHIPGGGTLPVGQRVIEGELTIPEPLPAGAQIRLTINGRMTYVEDFTIYQMRTAQVPIENQHSGAISSQIVQLYNHINLALFGVDGAISRISVGEKGVTLKGEHIYLDGKVSMDEAFVKTLLAKDITADTITAANATFARLIAVSIDAMDITTNRLRAVEAAFNSWDSYVKITGNGIWVNTNSGNKSVEINQNGMDIFWLGADVGRVGAAQNTGGGGYPSVMHVGAYRGRAVALSSKKNGDASAWVRSLWVDGTSGDIKIGAPLMAYETGYGITLHEQQITGEGTGVSIFSATNPNVGIAFMPSGIWWRTGSHAWRNLTTWATGN